MSQPKKKEASVKGKPKPLSEGEGREVRVTCTGTELVDVDDLVPFQGRFKTLAKGDYEKWRNTAPCILRESHKKVAA